MARTRGRTSGKAALPTALVKQGEKLVAKKKARLLAEAKELIAVVRRKRQEISEAFYDIGLALQRLKSREMRLALGYATFEQFCTERLGIAVELAARLVDVVGAMTREEAIAAGQSRAFALVAVAEATPEADTPGQLLRRGKVKVPGGREVDTKKASTRALLGAAKDIRAAAPRKSRRGRTSSPEERERALSIQAALHAAGLDEARAEAVAGKPGAESTLRVERVPFSKLGALAKILAKHASG